MNIQEFIETSGVLEEYVMGTLPEKEKQGVECLAKTYPEIQTELLKLQTSLEKYAFLHKKTPPDQLKEQLFSQMTFAEEEEEEEPIRVISETEQIVAEDQTQPKGRALPLWGQLSAAASVLLFGLVAWLFVQNNKLSTEKQELANQVNGIESREVQKTKLLAEFANPNNRVIHLKGLEKSATSSVTVFWNKTDNSVALKVDDLPTPAAGKQYQLWTIVDAKPVDMGMIDADFQEKLIKMKAVTGSPMAFAITLEKTGGSPQPTLEEMYVMGEV